MKEINFLTLKYRSDIDGLRAISILAVIVFHTFPELIPGGFIGVDIFFVISGYLISGIILKNLNSGTFSLIEFYKRRIKRIFPALILIFIFCFIMAKLALFPSEIKQIGKHIAAGSGFISNIILWEEAGYFDNSSIRKPLLHLWSLGIEEQFYIIWPILLWSCWKYRLSFFKVIILTTLASFLLNVTYIEKYSIATFYLPLTRFWELSFGSLLAFATLYRKEKLSSIKENICVTLSDLLRKNETKINIKLDFLGFSLLTYGFFKIDTTVLFPGFWALVPVLGALLIILAGPDSYVNRVILSNKVMVKIGLISFPLYCWHWPILSFMTIIFGVTDNKMKCFAIAISFLLAFLTVEIIEKPFRFGHQKSNLKVFILLCFLLATGVFGFCLYQCNWFYHSESKSLMIKRRDPHVVQNSISWYKGKEDWLFLGNDCNQEVAKLKLAILPSKKELEECEKTFSKVCKTAALYHIKVVLIIGPNKSSIYPEYLPDEITPSSKKYYQIFLERLKSIPNLIIYDPSNELISLKKTEGILYTKTDSHWNPKGAYLAYSGLAKKLQLPIPEIEFKIKPFFKGDILLGITKLNHYPLNTKDNYEIQFKEKVDYREEKVPDKTTTIFSNSKIDSSKNETPLSNKYIWVIGDSFTDALKPYFNATFKQVDYVGHSQGRKLNKLPKELEKTNKKPDIIFIIKVERNF